jgi:hypothetical protein
MVTTREPFFATKIQEARSGKELATAWWSLPKYRYTIQVGFLREAAGRVYSYAELSTLTSFFEAQKGSFDTFSFVDPKDGTVRTCRFEEDGMVFERDEFGIWVVKTIKLRTVK